MARQRSYDQRNTRKTSASWSPGTHASHVGRVCQQKPTRRQDDPRVEMETDPHGKSGVAVCVKPRAVFKSGEADVISSRKTAVATSRPTFFDSPPTNRHKPAQFLCLYAMPKTRNQTLSAEDAEKPDQKDVASDVTPTDTSSTAEPNIDKQEDGAASKANDRLQRFKALQARAVRYPISQKQALNSQSSIDSLLIPVLEVCQ